MKKHLIFCLTALVLCGCDVSSSLEKPGSEGSSESSSIISIKTIQISSNYIRDKLNPGDSINTNSGDSTLNYIVLDADGCIGYTAAFISSGYGTRLKSYLSVKYGSTITDGFKSGTFTIPEGFTGYEISTEGYARFVNEASDGVISVETARDSSATFVETWNSSSNEYLNDDIRVVIAKGTDMETRNTEAFRLSSIFDSFNFDGKSSYLMKSPYSDDYEITCENATFKIFDNDGKEIKANQEGKYSFVKNQLIRIDLEGTSLSDFNLHVTATKYNRELPYEISQNPDLSTYDTVGDPSVNPLKAQDLNVTKRDDGKGLYVNCNNPEALYDEAMNTVLTGQEVTNKDVFFTFEHNNKFTGDFYYGYRVTNTGEDDIFVTVKNVGYQVDEDGTWLGEDEWTQFYNLQFGLNYDKLTASQKKNYDAYIGFCGTYRPKMNQPITYRIPKGKYIYVMGGTSTDAYKNINVLGSADHKINKNELGCSNGAVLFSVTGGKAFGQFMAYTDSNAAGINASEYVTQHKQYGYSKYIKVGEENKKVGLQYGGYDTCHGVVDTNLTYHFNDVTPNGNVKVNYKNNYYSTTTTGTPYAEVKNKTTKTYNGATSWVTHINPATTPEAVGTDMTRYITTDHDTGEEIVIEPGRYDGLGGTANIGNWMVDYIDTFTLVNQGSKDRKFTYTLTHNGVILGFVRDENGFVDEEAHAPTYHAVIATSSYGAAISDKCIVTVVVPAHSVKRFSVDYNLCANSNGYIKHEARLKDAN